jgi:hypothetical protein
MTALTLEQPWATLIAMGAKQWETRGWKPRTHPGVIAIHAGKKKPSRARIEAEPFASTLLEAGVNDREDLPRSSIVAVARLGNFVKTDLLIASEERPDSRERAFGDFSAGRVAWEITDVLALPNPIPLSGALGLWTITDDEVLEDLEDFVVEVAA